MGRSQGKQKLKAPLVDAAKGGSKSALGCLLLIALPFALFGTAMAGVVAWNLWTCQAAQRWVETPAMLLEAELKSNSDGDGTTYHATARYAYEFNGRPYESDRVSLYGGSDNVGSFQHDRGKELEDKLAAGGRTVCYVNPRDPNDALLYRELRPGMVGFMSMFALVFGGIGYGLLFGGLHGRRIERRKAEAEKAHPNKPWMWREDWAAGRIRSSEGKTAWFITLFAVIWNAVTWPVATMVWFDANVKWGLRLLVSLFPLVGAGLAVTMFYLWLRRLKWGKSEFEMAAVPGVLGGPLAGVIHAPAGIRPADGFKLRLACNETTRTTSGSKTETKTEARWESEQTIHRELAEDGGAKTVIPVKFLVPFHQPASGDDIAWQLEVRAETQGIDYYAEFDVPVFQTGASSSAISGGAVEEAIEAATPATDFRTTVARMNAVVEEELPDRRVIYFPMLRNVAMGGFLLLFTAIWTAVGVGLLLTDAPRIFAIVMLAIDALLVYATARALLMSTRLEYSRGGVKWSNRLLGIGRERELVRSAIKTVVVDKSGTTVGNTAYRKVVAQTADGEVTLVKEIQRVGDAEALAADIRGVLELGERGATLEGALPEGFKS
jgi:hypothetical protein